MTMRQVQQPLLPNYYDDKDDKYCSCCPFGFCRCRTMFGCCVGSFALLLVAAVFVGVLGWFLVLPPMIESNIHSATIAFDSIEMSNATMNKNGTAVVHMLVKTTLEGKMHAEASAGVINMTYQGAYIGQMPSPALTIKKGGYQNTIDENLHIASVEAFDQFSLDLISNPNVSLSLKSEVQVKFPIFGFKLTLPGTYKMEKNVTILGTDNLQASIISTDLIEDKGVVTMSLIANLPNPSIVSIVDLGDLTFNISYKGSHITTAVAQNVELVEGNTTLEIRAPMLPQDINNNPAALEMLGNYISNLTTEMEAVVIRDSVPLYSSFLGGYSMSTTLQPLANPILRVTIMNMTEENVGRLFAFNSTLIATRFGIYNPLSIPLRITNINTDVTFDNNGTLVHLGNVSNNTYVDGTALDITIPPKNYHLSEPLFVHVHNVSMEIIMAMSGDMGPEIGYICLGAHGDVESKLGDLDTTTKYLQGETILTCNTAGSPEICLAYLNGTKPSPCN